MFDIEALTREMVDWFKINNISFALIGGLAVSFRTVERFTRDIDFAVVVNNDAHAEQIVRDLAGSGFRIETLLEQTAHDRIATVRLSKGSTRNIVVDLLFASSGIEREIVAEGEVVEILDGVQLTIASLSGLIALKVLSADADARPQDEIDLKHLLKEADSTELKRAEELLALIERRGYNRGKNLLLDLIKYQKRFLE